MTNLATLAKLAQMSVSASGARRRDLLDIVTALFLSKTDGYTKGETDLFGDIIGLLSSEFEPHVRAGIAARLSSHPKPPAKLMADFARDEIAVAASVLEKSRALDDTTLIAITKSSGQDHIIAMTRRDEISAGLAVAIVERGDDEAVACLLANEPALINRRTMEHIAHRALTAPCLHAAFVGRADMEPDLLNGMFFVVSSAQRRQILRSNDRLAPGTVERFVAQNRDRLAPQMAASGTVSPAENFINEAEASRTLSESFLIDLLRNRQLAEFLYGFARLTGLDVRTTKRILQDRSAEALAVACKATRFDRATFSTFVLLTDTSRQRTSSEVNALMDLYTSVNIDTAQRTICFWRIGLAHKSAQANAA